MSDSNGGDHALIAPLAAYAASLESDQLPDSAIWRLKNSVRDALACGLYGSSLPWGRMVADVAHGQAPLDESVIIWGSDRRAGAFGGALANGVAVQAYELDDLHAEASLHGSSTMLPATLALADLRGGVSGRDLMASLAVGWEVGLRINRCVGTLLQFGWHPPTIMGTVAAAAAAGRLLKLPAEAMQNCLNLAILQASGLTVVQYGGMAKRLYAGRAAEIGVQSALLAERGFTTPSQVLEHPFGGFLNTFGQGRGYEAEAISDGLGEVHAANSISFKLYSCCAAIHPAIDLLGDLISDHSDLSEGNIAHIDIYLTDYGLKHVGFSYEPDNATTAQFSAQYAFAVRLLEGAVFVDQFRDELLADPNVLNLIERIEVHHDPGLDSSDIRARRTARVEVRLNDGRLLAAQGFVASGHPERPASEEDLKAKFSRLAEVVLDRDQSEELAYAVRALDEMPDVRSLTDLTRPR